MIDTVATTRLPSTREVRAAHLAALCPLPSGLWRCALAVGLPVGYAADDARRLFDVPGAGTAYLLGLSVVLEGLGLLSFALVRPWGDRLPTRLVTVGAATGAVLASLVWIPFAALWWFTPGDGALTGATRVLVGLLYLPLAAWGPLLGFLLVARRRRITLDG